MKSFKKTSSPPAPKQQNLSTGLISDTVTDVFEFVVGYL